MWFGAPDHPGRGCLPLAYPEREGNTMPVVSTAHFEMDDDDQDAAYRDEPGLTR